MLWRCVYYIVVVQSIRFLNVCFLAASLRFEGPERGSSTRGRAVEEVTCVLSGVFDSEFSALRKQIHTSKTYRLVTDTVSRIPFRETHRFESLLDVL